MESDSLKNVLESSDTKKIVDKLYCERWDQHFKYLRRMKKQAKSTLGLAGMLWNEVIGTKLLVDTLETLTSQYLELGTKNKWRMYSPFFG